MSKALVNLIDKHLQYVKYIMRYLRGIIKLSVIYKFNSKAQFDLHVYIDTDFVGGALPDNKSTFNYIFFLAGGLINWQFKR